MQTQNFPQKAQKWDLDGFEKHLMRSYILYLLEYESTAGLLTFSKNNFWQKTLDQSERRIL